MKHPYYIASLRLISGSGFAIAKIIGFGHIFLIHYFLNVFLVETPIKMFAPIIAVGRVPFII